MTITVLCLWDHFYSSVYTAAGCRDNDRCSGCWHSYEKKPSDMFDLAVPVLFYQMA